MATDVVASQVGVFMIGLSKRRISRGICAETNLRKAGRFGYWTKIP
jgi:hypothetical protein